MNIDNLRGSAKRVATRVGLASILSTAALGFCAGTAHPDPDITGDGCEGPPVVPGWSGVVTVSGLGYPPQQPPIPTWVVVWAGPNGQEKIIGQGVQGPVHVTWPTNWSPGSNYLIWAQPLVGPPEQRIACFVVAAAAPPSWD
jgi:hypothetical protein